MSWLLNEISKNDSCCSLPRRFQKHVKEVESLLSSGSCLGKDVVGILHTMDYLALPALPAGVFVLIERGMNRDLLEKEFNPHQWVYTEIKDFLDFLDSMDSWCNTAVRQGKLEWLVWAREYKKATWDEETCSTAALYGHLPILVYLRSHHCPWDKQVYVSAAKNGHWDVFRYAHENNCPKGRGGSASSHLCYEAARMGCLEMVLYILQEFDPSTVWDSWTSALAAEGGHLNLLEYAHSRGYPINNLSATLAAKEGHLDILEFMFQHEYPWDEETCAQAAQNGHWDCLLFAHRHGCPLGTRITYFGAESGNLEIVLYGHQHRDPETGKGGWDKRTTAIAAKHGHRNIVEYAYRYNLPWDEED